MSHIGSALVGLIIGVMLMVNAYGRARDGWIAAGGFVSDGKLYRVEQMEREP